MKKILKNYKPKCGDLVKTKSLKAWWELKDGTIGLVLNIDEILAEVFIKEEILCIPIKNLRKL